MLRGSPVPPLLRSTLTLLTGSALAQALPLALAPVLTRLYTPEQFGQFTIFTAVAANIGVVACARYEYALPLEVDAERARSLLALCIRVLVAVTLLCVPLALWLSLDTMSTVWLWLPWMVASAGAVQCLTLWATRGQRFSALAGARVVQYGGAALAQVGGAFAVPGTGAHGLIAGPVLANVATLALLHRPAPAGGWRGLWRVPRADWFAAAKCHRSFPLLNAPHAFSGALQDTLTVLLLIWWSGDAAVGFWGLAMRVLKAPATLVGGAVSQVLYPSLVRADEASARQAVRQVMWVLMALALPLVLGLVAFGPALFAALFGEPWREAGELARALAPYIGLHFVASPLAVVTLAWQAQGWALRLALLGQLMFLGALCIGLQFGGLQGAAWAVSAGMLPYFAFYFWSLACWPMAKLPAPLVER